MEPTKPMIIGGFAAGGASFIAGTALSGSAGGHQLPTPFLVFGDIGCTTNANASKKVYSGLEKPEIVREGPWTRPKAYQFNLRSLNSVTGTANGCLRMIWNKYKGHQYKQGELILTVETALFKDKYGIILLNAITNLKHYGGPASHYRALFLEKGDKWKIEGGVEWKDEAFSKKLATAKKLKWTGLPETNFNKELDWDNKAVAGDQFSVFWKPENTKSETIFQVPNISINGSSTSQDFWNGQEEPLSSDANISKPSALFVDGRWVQTTADCCKDIKSRVKSWLDLFKGDKGTWVKPEQANPTPL